MTVYNQNIYLHEHCQNMRPTFKMFIVPTGQFHDKNVFEFFSDFLWPWPIQTLSLAVHIMCFKVQPAHSNPQPSLLSAAIKTWTLKWSSHQSSQYVLSHGKLFLWDLGHMLNVC